MWLGLCVFLWYFRALCCLICFKTNSHRKDCLRNIIPWWGPANEHISPTHSCFTHKPPKGPLLGHKTWSDSMDLCRWSFNVARPTGPPVAPRGSSSPAAGDGPGSTLKPVGFGSRPAPGADDSPPARVETNTTHPNRVLLRRDGLSLAPADARPLLPVVMSVGWYGQDGPATILRFLSLCDHNHVLEYCLRL